MPRTLDLVVIGTGAAATSVAYPCRSAGWSVGIVDSRPFGGTCALRGCDPKKVMVGVSAVLNGVRAMQGVGLKATDAHLDWQDLMAFKRTFTDPVPEARIRSFAKAGLVAFHGAARFTSPQSMDINGEEIEAQHFAICAGAVPNRLGIPGEDLLITSDDYLELERLPRSIVFVGGGYIAFEFAHLSARAGAEVTILHRGKRPLEHFDPSLTEMLVQATRELGIDVLLNCAVETVERRGEGFLVRAAGGVSVPADCVVHAAGRVPNLDALDLPTARVSTTRGGVQVNEFLGSVSNPRVYAAGDAAASGGPQLTPVAGYEGRIVAENLLHGNREKPDYNGCASTVFTIPPLASVGFTEDAARDKGLQFETHTGDSSGWYSSKRLREKHSGYKVLVQKDTDRILGAHLLGDSAEEHINVFALAIRAGVPASVVRQTLFAYPTHGSNTQYML